jgi:hypothetical protein
MDAFLTIAADDIRAQGATQSIGFCRVQGRAGLNRI